MDEELKNRVEVSRNFWFSEGVKRYGENMKEWKFRCPCCHEVFSIADWNRLKKTDRSPLPIQDCPNARNPEDIELCIWSGFGSLNHVHIRDETIYILTTAVFDFADRPLLGGRHV